MTLKQKSIDKDLLSFLSFLFQIFNIRSNSKQSRYSIVPRFNENFTEFKNSDEKFAFSDFTCNGSFGMNSTCKVQPITTIFPLQGLLLYFFMCNTQILVIKMYFMQSNLSLMMWK